METGLRCAGIRGDLKELTSIPAASTPEKTSSPDEIDIIGMAEWALNYLEHNPVKEFNYQARFHCYPLGLPPMPPGPDHVAVGDTECRIDWEFWYMREITGRTEQSETEQGLRKHLLDYVKDDGFAWCTMGACEETKSADEVTPGLAIMPWTTGKIIWSLCEDYERTGNRNALDLAAKMAHALTGLATWDTGRAYHEGGTGAWQNGKVIQNWGQNNFPADGLHLMRYYLTSGDEEILRYIIAFADGFIAELQPNRGIARIAPDGSHRGHAHLTMHVVWGVAWLGEVIAHPRYVEFARRVYESQRKRGYDTGWFSAAYWDTGVQKLCETCATSDMMSTAACLARAGYSEYWDHVERYVRNYIRQAQFFITPDFETYYRGLYPGRDEDVDKAIKSLRDVEGGFCGIVGPNDMTNWIWGPNANNVSGCCSPEGIRAVYTAWKNTVIEKPDRILVNMSLPVVTSAATVTTGLPQKGRVTVTPHKAKDVYVRPPVWAPRNEVRAFHGTKEITLEWRSDYLYFARPDIGREITVTYPIVCFHQHLGLNILADPESDTQEAEKTSAIVNAEMAKSRLSQRIDVSEASVITFKWWGNCVVGTEPVGPCLPSFCGPGRPLPVPIVV